MDRADRDWRHQNEKPAGAALCFMLVLMAASSVWGSDYVVKEGDTLSGIAEAELGATRRWPEIAELNGLTPPHKIVVGQRLRLPSGALGEGAATAGTGGDAAAGGGGRGIAGWAQVLIAVVLMLALVWLFGALCIRLACWFSLVEASFGRGCLLSLFLALLVGMCVGLMVLAGHGVAKYDAGVWVGWTATLLVAILYFVGAALVTKRVLLCKWRSVVTVLVMASFVGNLIVAGLMFGAALLLPNLIGIALGQEWLWAVVSG